MISNRSAPPGSVIPQLAYADVHAAAEWLERVFGFVPRLVIGNHRVQLTVGDGAVVAMERRADSLGENASTLVRVDDVDGHFRRAEAAGATIVSPPQTQPYGERQYVAEDLAGHHWTFSQSVADIDPADWGGSLVGRR